MKKYKIHPATTSFYYSTLTITSWLPIVYFTIIIDSLKYCQDNKGLSLLGYVIMPTHMHLITSNSESTNLSHIMRDFKNFTSKKIRDQLTNDNRKAFLDVFARAAERYPKQQYKVWQDEFHPVGLISEKWFTEKLNYMHYNPVRKGFVESPEHWKYSSAKNWYHDDDSIIKIDEELVF